MAVYMIDYENVKTGGLNGISRLTAEDSVIIFYSENANRLTFDLHQRLMASPARIEYREVTVGGHNALDFQLVTYLGYLIAKEPKGQYLIISNDRGFEHVVNFWRKDGLLIGLLPYLKDPSYALQKAVSREQPRATELPAAKEQEADPAEESSAVAEDMKHDDMQQDMPVSESEPIAEAASEVAILPDEEPTEETVKEPVAQEQPTLDNELIVEEPIVEQPVPEEATETTATESEPTFRDGESREELPVEIVTLAMPEATDATETAEETPAKPAPQKKRSRRQTAAKKQQTERRADALTEAPAEKPAEKHSKPKPAAKAASALPNAKELRTLLDGIVADDPEARLVESALEKYKTKLGLNNALVKTFGNQKAGEIYQKLKPFLSGKKGC